MTTTEIAPAPVTLHCPACGSLHIDEGEWATKPHKTHRCAKCQHEWQPFAFPTVGVDVYAVMEELRRAKIDAEQMTILFKDRVEKLKSSRETTERHILESSALRDKNHELFEALKTVERLSREGLVLPVQASKVFEALSKVHETVKGLTR